MMASTLARILATLPRGACEVSVKGRKQPIITASIPDAGPLPDGWAACMEHQMQHIPGTRRVRFASTIEETLW
jgi:hypothetical protein